MTTLPPTTITLAKADMEEAARDILRFIGEDPERQGLQETPARFAKAFKAYAAGYGQDPAAVLKCFEDGAEGYDEMVVQTNIPVYSLCEHHLAPFFGVVHIAYIPTGKVVGLSKLSRVTDIFAKRLQVQERLTKQIAECLQTNLNPKGVAVVAQCRHMCMEMRGVCKQGTVTTTSAMLGAFRDDGKARSEFLSLVTNATK